MIKENNDPLTEQIIGCCIEVHKALGPGLLESAYEECLAYELTSCNIQFQKQLALPVAYKEVKLDCGYRMDFVVDKKVILELKSIESLLPIHEAQILTYMKLAEIRKGLLINFNVKLLKNGIRRFVL